MSRAEEIAHAREVDTEVARLYGEYWAVQHEVVQFFDWAADSQKDAAKYAAKGWVTRAEESQALADKYTDHAKALMPEAKRLRAIAQDYNDANYTGWSRFFLVQHIHNTQYCPSFRPTTRVGWLPNVSGLTEVEAVAEYGATLCTKCFPDAPVELTTQPADPTLCTGSGGPYDKENLTGREQAYYSPAGYCPVCGKWVSLTARFSGKLRKHKA